MNVSITPEHERRFIVTDIDPSIWSYPSRRIEQCYLTSEGSRVLRMRLTDNAVAEITMKEGIGIARTEHTVPLHDIDAARFMLSHIPLSISKDRFVRDGWEIDRMRGSLTGLIVAEYEMPTSQGIAAQPPWIGSMREVTMSVTNLHLAHVARDLSGGDPRTADKYAIRKPTMVLTGGPCSGKSSIIRELHREFGDLIHCVPETATILIGQVGAKPPAGDPVATRMYQRSVYRIQRSFEEASALQAMLDGKVALLLDRGAVDGAAYMHGGLSAFPDACRTDIASEYARYDAVLYMHVPPRHIYETHRAGNPSRYETHDMAEAVGKRIRTVWQDHPGFVEIHPSQTWEERLQEVRAFMSRFLAAHT